MFSKKSVNISKPRNWRIKSPVILVKKNVCKTFNLLCGLFVLNAIVQGTSFGCENSHLPVSVLQQDNPTTMLDGPISFEKEQVPTEDQQDWYKRLEDTVENAETLDLAQKNLKKLPSCLKRAKKLKELDISRNRLVDVPSEFLDAFESLEKINISRNGWIAFVNEGGALKRLKCFNAENCGWKVVPESVWRLHQLEELYLGKNLFENFDFELLLNLPLLRILDLSGNRRVALKSHPWTDLVPLQCLILQNVDLDEIPDSIKTLKKLISLDVRDNEIKRLDPKIFLELESLKELDIGNNRDLVVDESTWESLRGLTSLKADRLGMKEFPQGLKKLTKLQKLKLFNNHIPLLNSADFVEFPDLEYLGFSKYFGEFDVDTTGWGRLKSLKKLIIPGSTLKELGDWVGELQSLEEINLRWSRIHTINDEFFVALSKLPNFRVLDLGFNSIHTLPSSILLLKDKKVKIMLKGNSISFQPSETNFDRELLKREFGENIVF